MTTFDAIDLENLKTNPYCTHGPTILFENKKTQKKFYSCSATRDHKKCNFYQNYSIFSPSQIDKWLEIYKKCQTKVDQNEINLTDIRNVPLKCRNYCKKCDKFVIVNEDKLECSRKKHELVENIKKIHLREPCKYILNPITDDQANAVGDRPLLYSGYISKIINLFQQYLFDERTIQYVFNIFKQYSFDSILCIGTPSLFENLKKLEPTVKCLLLDIDERFVSFKPYS